MVAKTLADYYADRKDMAPFATGDVDILQDATFTSQAGATSPTVGDAFTIGGTGAVFDANGFNGKGTAWLYVTTWTGAAALAASNQGSVYLQVQRSGLALNETDIPATFIQSTGQSASVAQRYAFDLAQTAGFTYDIFIQRDTAANSGYTSCHIKSNSVAVNKTAYLNSRTVNGTQATDYAEIVITWKNKSAWLYLDGCCIGQWQMDSELSTANLTNPLQRLIVGAQTQAGGAPFGDYYIKRVQISRRVSKLATNPVPIAFFGDSFAKAFLDSASYTKPADLFGLFDGSGRAGMSTGLAELIRLFAVNDNMVLFNIRDNDTTENGHGYASDLTPFSAATKTAVVTFNPEILVCFGSVNDINTAAPTATLLASVLAILDQFIDGCSHLREIHFFETFFAHKGSTTTNTAAYIAEHARTRGILAAIDGYRDMVHYHLTYDLVGGDDYSQEYSIGSGTGNIVDANANIHPSSLGHLQMAQIVYDAIHPFMVQMPI